MECVVFHVVNKFEDLECCEMEGMDSRSSELIGVGILAAPTKIHRHLEKATKVLHSKMQAIQD